MPRQASQEEGQGVSACREGGGRVQAKWGKRVSDSDPASGGHRRETGGRACGHAGMIPGMAVKS